MTLHGRCKIRPAARYPARLSHCIAVTVLLVAASTVGLAQQSDSDDVNRSLKRLSLDELLALEVTSVSKQPERLLEAAAAIQVVTNSDIRRSGATRLPEALRLAGNLQVAQKGAHGWGISARGFNTDLANKLLVLIDGRAVYTPLYSGVFWDRQDYVLEDIDRIEVVSGPGGTLWGANAVNGVVNVVSKSARDTQGLFLEAATGDRFESVTAVRYGGALAPNVHFRVYGKYSDRDGNELADGSEVGNSRRMAQGGFRLDAATSAGDELTFQGDLHEAKEVLTGGRRAVMSGHNLLGRWTRRPAEDSEFSLQLYYDRTHLFLPTDPLIVNGLTLAPAGQLQDDLDTYDLDFQHRFRVNDRHKLMWGLGYRFTRDSLANSPALGFFPPRLDQDLFSGFVQDEVSWRENLTLTLGTKVEHNDYTGFETEPGIRLRWLVSPRQSVWAAVSRAVRMPSRIDRDVAQPSTGPLVLLRGGADFQSETVVAYEAGYRRQIGSSAFVSLAAFHNSYDDLRSTGLTPVTILPLVFENNLEGTTRGLEFDGGCELAPWWRLHGSATFLREDLRGKAGRYDFNNALNETADPRHQFALRSAMDLPRNWELDLLARRVGELRMNNAGVAVTVPAYTELDIRLAWHASPALEVSFVGQNLLHARHPEYGIPSATRAEISRNLYARITWRY